MVKRSDIQIRDPFILPMAAENLYYMFGSTDKDIWRPPAVGFDFYTTADFENYEGPFVAFRPAAGFWSDRNFWAPEVHEYRGNYYMFATFCSAERHRGTQILVSESGTPRGPYVVHSDGPITPEDWGCLDGTLYVDPKGAPWMVFCHEWTQIDDGTINAVRLREDLKGPLEGAGEPMTLFAASEAPWGTGLHNQPKYVTDGPFMYRARNGELLLLWSSFIGGTYAIGVARSKGGDIAGPWVQDAEPIFKDDGGHGMVFRRFDGQLMLTIHTPNDTPNERPIFLPVDERDGNLQVRDENACSTK